MRLTEKETNIIGLETGFYRIKKDNCNSFITDNCGNHRELNSLFLGQQKLAQLEDIEEELGLDLIILFKALKSGVYYYIGQQLTRDYVSLISKYLTNYNDKLGYDFITMFEKKLLLFEDYGKTWALTKEELL